MSFIEKNVLIIGRVLIAKITIFKSRSVVNARTKIAINIGFTAYRFRIDMVQINRRVIDQLVGSPPWVGYIPTY